MTNFIKSEKGDLVTNGHLSEQDSKRVVACVNACAGLTNEQLESGKSLDRLRAIQEIGRQDAIRQRDELLAVLPPNDKGNGPERSEGPR